MINNYDLAVALNAVVRLLQLPAKAGGPSSTAEYDVLWQSMYAMNADLRGRGVRTSGMKIDNKFADVKSVSYVTDAELDKIRGS